MSLPGKVAVNSGGAATYSIPISVPPGTAGVTPTLSLDYNSQAGNGLLGVGWALGGIPLMGRCPRTMAQDGVRGGVNFDANDRFCLDGQRLIAVSGTYGADGTVYRTEIDTYAKIISRGSTGTGPSWFEVRTKSGQVMEFGNTTDSRIIAQGKTTARLWALNKIADVKGNYLTVLYTNDTTNGQYYPIEINYTGNSAAGLAPYNKVQFVYATRPDIAPGYHAGSLIKTTVRLTNVKTYANAALVADYQLTYQQSGPTNRSRMTSVTLCSASSACLPATSFVWTNVTAGIAASQLWLAQYGTNWGWTNNDAFPRYVVDVNGDGLPDVMGCSGAACSVGLSTGTSFGAPQQWVSLTGVPGGAGNGWGSNNVYPRILADINSDGRPDMVAFSSNGTYVLINNGTTFGSPQLWTPHYTTATGWNSMSSFPRMLVDMNGDGLADIVGFAGPGVSVAINSGTAFVNAQLWSPYYGTDTGWTTNDAYPRFVADLNGDGLPDVMGCSGSTCSVVLNTGTSLAAPQQWVSLAGVPIGAGGWGSNSINPRMLADMNGDGLPDMVAFSSNGVYVLINTGASFGSPQLWTSHYTTATGWTNLDSFPRILADMNGDGLPDLVGLSLNDGSIAFNTGSAFATPQTFSMSGGGTNWNSDNVYPRSIVDIKGIGFNGIVGFAAGGVYVAQNAAAGPPPDLLTTITSGLGLATSITYSPLTAASVYTKDTTATYPVVDIQAALYVASRVDAPNGIGGTYNSSYTYVGAKAEVTGRGYLGFRQTTITDLQTNIAETTTYRQDFPYIGMASASSKSIASLVLNQVANTYQFANASGGTTISPASAPYRVWLSQNVTSGKDLDGTVMPSVTTNYQYDAYGNPTQVAASTSDGFSRTVNNTYTNDVTNWLLGRLTAASVTSVTP